MGETGCDRAFVRRVTCATVICLLAIASAPAYPDLALSLRKTVLSTSENADGSFAVRMQISVRNTGDLVASEVQVSDAVADSIAPATLVRIHSVAVGGRFATANPEFDGRVDHRLLAPSETLRRDQTGTVTFTADIDPATHIGPFRNSAEVTAENARFRSTFSDCSRPDDLTTAEAGCAPTMIDLPFAILGLAKRAGEVESAEAGGFTVPLIFRVQNFGNATAHDLQIVDSLAQTFADAESFQVLSLASSKLTINPSFDGDQQTLLLHGSDRLAAGDTASVSLTVRFQPGTTASPFLNQAFASARRGVSDDSTNGANPDPDGDGSPEEFDPTPIPFNVQPIASHLGLAKAASFGRVVSGSQRETTITIALENLGESTVDQVSVIDDLVTTFAAADSFEVVPGTLQSETLAINPSFDGRSDLHLLQGTDAMPAGARTHVQFNVRFTPRADTGEIFNSAVATVGGIETDVSTNGADADPNGDGIPDEDVPTPIPYRNAPVSGLQLTVEANPVTTMVGRHVTYSISIRNTLPGDQRAVTVTDSGPPAFRPASDAAELVRAGADGRLGTTDDEHIPIAVELGPQLTFAPFDLAQSETVLIQFPSRVTPAASIGPHTNHSVARSPVSQPTSDEATVNVVADPLFQKATVIGKVFNDRNRDGVQSGDDENGIPGAVLLTPEGLIIRTDQHGRYHIADIDVPSTGRNYLVKLDPGSIPGDRLTVIHSDPKQFVRLVPGGLAKANFAVHWQSERVSSDCCGDFEQLDYVGSFDREKKLHIALESAERGAEGWTFQFKSESNYTDAAQCHLVAVSQPEAPDSTWRGIRRAESSGTTIKVNVADVRARDRLRYRLYAYPSFGGLCRDPFSGTQPTLADVDWTKERALEVPANNRYYPTSDQTINLLATSNLKLPAHVPYLVSRRRNGNNDVRERLIVDQSRLAANIAGIWNATEKTSLAQSALAARHVEAAGFEQPPQHGGRRGVVEVRRDQRFYQDDAIFSAESRTAELECCDIRTALDAQADDANQLYAFRFTNHHHTAIELCMRPSAATSSDAYDREATACWRGAEETNRIVTVEAEQTIEFYRGSFLPSGPAHSTDWEALFLFVRDPTLTTHPLVTDSRIGYRVSRWRTTPDGRWKRPRTVGICGPVSSRLDIVGGELLAAQRLNASGPILPDINVPVVGSADNRQRFAAIVDLTLGSSTANGALEAFGGPADLDRGLFGDGRVAGFWQGVRYVGGDADGAPLEWTVQFDSSHAPLRDLNDNAAARDRQRLFRRLDTDNYYPTYGDDSTTIMAAESQGSMYAEIAYRRNRALWGNFETAFTDTQLGYFDRSLYGLRLTKTSALATVFGDRRYEIELFASEAQSVSANASFLATGGSLYYLPDTDVVMGSEKVWVEVRRNGTTQLEERQLLTPGADYEFDPAHGRLLLKRPLSQVVRERHNPVVRNEALQGERVFLHIDYEHVPAEFSAQDLVYGVRGKTWLADRVSVGLTHVTDEQGSDDHRLDALDVTWRYSSGTYIAAEVAASNGNTVRGNASFDGGLSFNLPNNRASPTHAGHAHAFALDTRIDLADFRDRPGYMQAWWQKRDAGFASSRFNGPANETDTGFNLDSDIGGGLRVLAGMASLERSDGLTQRNARFQLSKHWRCDVDERCWQLDSEIRWDDVTADAIDTPILFSGTRNGQGGVAGMRVARRVDESTTVYGTAQHDVHSDRDYGDNRLLSTGVNRQMNDSVALSVEISKGDRGSALLGGIDYALGSATVFNVSGGVGSGATTQFASRYQLAEGRELYGSYSVNPDRTDTESSLLTFGQRQALGNRLALYGESRVGRMNREASTGHVFGLDYDLSNNLTLATTFQGSRVVSDRGEFERMATSIGGTYTAENWRLHSRLELRRDEGQSVDNHQFVTASQFSYLIDDNRRLVARLNAALVRNRMTDRTSGRFIELNAGFAYRPVRSDRFNALVRYGLLHDVGTPGQIGTPGDERSHLLSTEGIFELSPRFQLKGKLAYREGRQRLRRGAGGWQDVSLGMIVAGFGYRFGDTGSDDFAHNPVELLTEYRTLIDRKADASSTGVLVGLYKHIDPRLLNSRFIGSLRFGVGYNFSGFDDDLRRGTYRSDGFFIDAMAAF